MKRVAMFITAAILMCQIARAQQCEAILGYVRDITDTKNSLNSTYSFRRFFCDQTFSSYQEAHDRGAKLGIVIDDLPISFSGYDRGSQWSQYQRSICESVEVNAGLSTEFRQHIEQANAKVVDAWKDCVSSPGVHFWAEANEGDPKLVDLAAKYNGLQRKYETRIQPLQITPPSALACQRPYIASRRFLNNQESRVSCTRTATADDTLPGANVVLPTSAESRSVKLPAIYPNPEYKDVTEEQHVPCIKYRHEFIQDGPMYGDKHIFHVECAAPSKISRWNYEGCEGGACPWLVRLDGSDVKISDTLVAIRLATNSSDPVKVSTTIYYTTTHKECVKHCEHLAIKNIPIE